MADIGADCDVRTDRKSFFTNSDGLAVLAPAPGAAGAEMASEAGLEELELAGGLKDGRTSEVVALARRPGRALASVGSAAGATWVGMELCQVASDWM